MITQYDVIILGLGAMGSATADRLAASGHKVLGFEQFDPIHDKGSSHGETRAIRKAYFEDDRYVPLMLRAYDLWEELEAFAGHQLLFKPGCVMMGAPTSPVLQGCERAARRFSLPHEMLDVAALERRGFRVPKETVGFFEPDGGYLLVEKCIEHFQTRAESHGADLYFEAKVSSWKSVSDGVEVVTEGKTFRAKKLVISLGSWLAKNSDLKSLSPKRTIQYWFRAKGGSELPVFFQDTGKGPWIYGFPKIGETMKLAFHNVFSDCDPDRMKRNVSEAEVAEMVTPAEALLPGLRGFARAKTCIYTMTPDEHFVLGPMKSPNENVFVAGGFSGHGFKFAPVIGEIIDDFVSGRAPLEMGLFNPYRFG